MSSINLSVIKQKNLQTMRQQSEALEKTSERLATGRRVNGPTDDPNAYFVSSGIDSRARDIDALLDNMTKAKSYLDTAETGLRGVQRFLEAAEAVIKSLPADATEEQRNTAAKDFTSLIRQLEDVAKDAEFDGKNLLAGTGNTVTVYLDEDSNAILHVDPVDYTNADSPDGLNIPDLGDGDLATQADVDAILARLTEAKADVARTGKTFAMQFRSVSDRQAFTENLTRALQTYANDLVVADTNEEGARLLALQTKQQLANTSLSISNQSEEYVLQLFGG